MIWILGFAGILLTLLGVWGGPTQKSPRREAESMARKQPTVSDAWEVLAKPLEEEMIKIPEHRPWYAPGGDRRFQQGALLGLGVGLMVAALTVSFAPRDAAPPQVATKEPAAGAPAANQPAPTQTVQPAPTQPVKPVNQNFTVEPGDLAPDIADKLKTAGLIADPDQFLHRVAERELDTSLKAGTFVIPTGADLDTVIDVLTS